MEREENRWMPPSPHREAIEADLRAGRARIVERGHNVPPLLVFEDGGMIELPRVRLAETRRGLQLVAADEPATGGETRFGDVCGTVDEILGTLREVAPGAELDPDDLNALIEDIGYMLARMTRRSQQYLAFFEGVQSIAATLLSLERPNVASAQERLDALRRALWDPGERNAARLEDIAGRAEHARALAQSLEDYLAQCKLAATRVGTLYGEVRGGRAWALAPDQGTPEPGSSG